MKKILAISNIIAVFAIILFIIQPFRTSPPTPNVTAGEIFIPTDEGSYCWNGLFSGHCVDKEYSSVVAMAGEEKPTVVSPGEKITVKFNKKPQKIDAEQWIGEEEVTRVELKDHMLLVPEQKGVYVYHLVAHWRQGDGSYVFSVEVK
ncbi:hypothetical protein CN378_13545 [Bacillus sp. AFS015802]|uniref:hypothetical protein n=1 Tax=Bacillus sp. AFS015802 TaxID=2033486 RepID=UPI000BF4814A|nr:hypothetical protein [Bacillus sp. AFS015802]PFA66742.1 hypothetical protein CN378_13545 [Bacillus sp. AFS015802]